MKTGGREVVGGKVGSFIVVCSLLWFMLLATKTHAQTVPVVNAPQASPNPVGSGARALGMGGAFIGIADDATAASWNPGGLIQLERPEISIVGSAQWSRVTFDSKEFPDIAGTTYLNRGDLNYFSIAYPFSIKRRNFVVSLNYQYLYDFNGAQNFGMAFLTLDPTFTLYMNYDAQFRQRGGLYTISPAIAVEILPNLSIGATFNFWPSHQGWESRFKAIGRGGARTVFPPPFDFIPLRTKIFDRGRVTLAHAFNGNLGLLWDVNKYVTIGLVYKFPFQVPVTAFSDTQSSIIFPPFVPGFSSFESKETKRRMSLHMPPSYGIGAAVHFSDRFTVDLDVYRTEWRQAFFRTKKGHKLSFANGLPMGEGKYKANIDPTHQVRLGAEYLFIFEKTVVPLRAGWFYDPTPSSNQPDTFYGVSVGTGISIGKLILDGAYQYRFGNGVAKDAFGADLKGTKASIGQHILLFSAILHF